MNISVIQHKSAHAKNPHSVFAVDGISLDVWVSKQTREEGVLDLVPAQGWLYIEEDSVLAWRRLKSLEPDTCTFVPILVCADDMDLSCSVVIVEQCVSADKVVWQRFGWDCSALGEVGSTIKWFKTQASASFSIADFTAAIEEFIRLPEDLATPH